MRQLRNIPSFKFAVLLIAGILTGSVINFSLLVLILTICFLIAVSVYFRKLNSPVSSVCCFMIIIVFGILKANIDFFILPANSVKYLPDTKRKSNIILTGVISEIPDYDSNSVKLLLRTGEIFTGKDTIFAEGIIAVTVIRNTYNKSVSAPPLLKAGDNIALRGKLLEAPGRRNPGEFDYRKYLELQEIYKMFYVSGYENVKVISRGNLSFLYQKIIFPCKEFALENIGRFYDHDESSYLKGLVTGEKGDISNEMKKAFIDAGVMHLIAVSGLNVAYIIISLTVVLSLFRLNLKYRSVITIIVLVFYCVFTGSTPSIVRATIMGILILIASVSERRINFYNIIGTSALIILILNSKQLFDAGFILSYSAVISMVFIYNLFEKIFIHKISEWNINEKKYVQNISVLFFTTLAAQIGTIPLTADYFGKVSVISLIANVIAVPLANLSLAIGFFQIITGIFSDYFSSIIAGTNNILLSFQLLFIKWCSSVKYASINVSGFSAITIFAYYFLLIFILTSESLRQFYFRFVIFIFTVSSCLLISHDFKKNLRVTFLDIGQGDCALIQTPDDKTILVDCGVITDKYNSGERTISPYLIRQGINRIDLIIITHLHNDHTGGLNYLLKNYEVGKIYLSGQKTETPYTLSMDSLIKIKNVQSEIIRSGYMNDEFKDLRMYFLFPDEQFVNESGETFDDNLNNGSVAFILKYRDNEIFFSGDIEKEAERFLYDNYSEFLKTDVLKVAHHGSITSSTIPFVLKNRPELAVISCGKFNKFNHPSDIVLNRFKITGTEIHRTDREGAVILESNGDSVNVKQWK